MSLIFKPKIPTALAFVENEAATTNTRNARAPSTSAKPWTNQEINKLVQLRAHNVGFRACAPLLNRGYAACVSQVVKQDLYGEINRQRQQIIQGILA